MCRGFESLLRYHLSPHSFDAVRVGLFAQEGGQASCYLDLDPSRLRRGTEHGDAFDQITHGLSAFRVACHDPPGQGLLKACELLLVAHQHRWVQRDHLGQRRRRFEFSSDALAFYMESGRPRPEHGRIAMAPRDCVNQPVDFSRELVKPPF
ncbi:MAG: hypothetical protein ACREC9_01115 [Methylocella sp.]